jgi:hypothetical protein
MAAALWMPKVIMRDVGWDWEILISHQISRAFAANG